MLVIAATWHAGASAARASDRVAAISEQDVAADLRVLARQRPWRCKDAAAGPVPETGWSGAPPACAWQERLRMHSWSGPALPEGSTCISAQAAWWSWTGGNGAKPVWRAAWPSHSLRDDSGAEKRIVIIRQISPGQWSVTEWRWSPSPRAATRAWQQGRWNALAARAEQFRQPPRAAAAGEARMLEDVLEANLGARPAERSGNVLKWQSDGLCLQAVAAPGAQQLQLPYSADDSRLEQRAAMQLQLARRYAKATWLSPFNLVPTPRHVRGGAKFYAVWLEGSTVKAQLWVPTKGDGPLVRVRITTELPAIPADVPNNPAVALRKQALEREVMALAARWAAAYE